jgi:hypothetical protein
MNYCVGLCPKTILEFYRKMSSNLTKSSKIVLIVQHKYLCEPSYERYKEPFILRIDLRQDC